MERKGNLIKLTDLSSDFIIDLKYATPDNFTGVQVYQSADCWLDEHTAQILIKAKEIFDTLSVLKQAATLLQILRFFKCNAETSDLSTIGGSNRSGTIRINKDITETEFSIIHRSACGLTERRQKV